MTRKRGNRPKVVKYGDQERQAIVVRVQGVRVRMQDQDMGKLYVLSPTTARELARALNYAAHHAERPTLPPEYMELLDAKLAEDDVALSDSTAAVARRDSGEPDRSAR